MRHDTLDDSPDAVMYGRELLMHMVRKPQFKLIKTVMSNKYKTIGALGNTVRIRTDRTWIITFPDGDEVKFNNQRYAIMSFKALLALGKNIKLEEETLIHFNKYGDVNDEKFRIDMTERVKRMMSMESKIYG